MQAPCQLTINRRKPHVAGRERIFGQRATRDGAIRRDTAWHKFGAVRHARCALQMRHGDAYAEVVNGCGRSGASEGNAFRDAWCTGLELASSPACKPTDEPMLAPKQPRQIYGDISNTRASVTAIVRRIAGLDAECRCSDTSGSAGSPQRPQYVSVDGRSGCRG